MNNYRVLLYYKYVPIDDPAQYVVEHRALCESLELRGRIIVGNEGLNGTVSGTVDATEKYINAMNADERTSDIHWKIDPADDHVFPKLSIKARTEVVTLGLGEEDIDPNDITGDRLSPKEFYEAMQRDDVILIDARNDYESAMGRFKGAICPEVGNFREFPEWIRMHREELSGKKILTYCTGGIRCEKFSGYLKKEGFEDVSQLEGGIVTYGKDEEVQGRDFDGLCYVFDQRIGVEVNQTETRRIISHCIHCGDECARYRNCGWPDCNDQFFLCEACEEAKGKFCCSECETASQQAAAVS